MSESIPSTGYIGGDSYPYRKHLNWNCESGWWLPSVQPCGVARIRYDGGPIMD